MAGNGGLFTVNYCNLDKYKNISLNVRNSSCHLTANFVKIATFLTNL